MSEVLKQYNSLAGKCSSKLDTSPASQIIEKMYENAGVEKVCTHTIINPEKCNHRRMTRCCGCDWLGYPPFTAAKQIELIKWLINFDYTHLSKLYGADINFSVVLAATINYLWKCLSKSEQEQIADILKG